MSAPDNASKSLKYLLRMGRLYMLRNPMTMQISDYLVILCSADGNGRSYFREAIEDCGAHFEFGYLTLEGARSDA